MTAADTRAQRAAAATELGRALAEAVADPDEFARLADAGLTGLARSDDLASVRRVAPRIAPVVGVSFFVVERVGNVLSRATVDDSPSNVLVACERLFGLPMLEARWLAFRVLDRLVGRDAERTWQLLRRASREAADWITVDALAHPFGRGILAEPFRWAELGQLVFAPSVWERRLVGSTIATIPFVDRDAGRRGEIAEHALPLLGSLIGDDARDVQKALSWALRSLTLVEPGAVEAFCDEQARIAAEHDDGHRAWVVRDAVAKLDPAAAAAIKGRVAAVRKRPGAPSTSDAAAIAASFVAAGGVPSLGGPHVERIPVAAR